MTYQLDMEDLKQNYAREEYNALRNDDEDFKAQWNDTENDFNEWFTDVFIPSFTSQLGEQK